MALLRSSRKLNIVFRSSTTTVSRKQSQHHLSVFSSRFFSTENEQPPPQQQQQPQQPQQPQQQFRRLQSDEGLPPPPSGGVVYGRMLGIYENMLKTDVINLLEGCRLTLDDIKVDYNKLFYPVAMMMQFQTESDFSAAFKEISRKGRMFKLEKIDRQQWDSIPPCNGNYVLLQGLPRNALMDDIARCLSGFNFDSSSFEIFTRAAFPEAIRMAKVRFSSPVEAMNAVSQKDGTFCLNNRIVTRLLQ